MFTQTRAELGWACGAERPAAGCPESAAVSWLALSCRSRLTQARGGMSSRLSRSGVGEIGR